MTLGRGARTRSSADSGVRAGGAVRAGGVSAGVAGARFHWRCTAFRVVSALVPARTGRRRWSRGRGCRRTGRAAGRPAVVRPARLPTGAGRWPDGGREPHGAVRALPEVGGESGDRGLEFAGGGVMACCQEVDVGEVAPAGGCGSALDRDDQLLGVDHAQRAAADRYVAVEQARQGDDLRRWPSGRRCSC